MLALIQKEQMRLRARFMSTSTSSTSRDGAARDMRVEAALGGGRRGEKRHREEERRRRDWSPDRAGRDRQGRERRTEFRMSSEVSNQWTPLHTHTHTHLRRAGVERAKRRFEKIKIPPADPQRHMEGHVRHPKQRRRRMGEGRLVQ